MSTLTEMNCRLMTCSTKSHSSFWGHWNTFLSMWHLINCAKLHYPLNTLLLLPHNIQFLEPGVQFFIWCLELPKIYLCKITLGGVYSTSSCLKNNNTRKFVWNKAPTNMKHTDTSNARKDFIAQLLTKYSNCNTYVWTNN